MRGMIEARSAALEHRIDVALFGAAGYTGLELAKLLAGHPAVRLACAASDAQAGKRVDEALGRRCETLTFVRTERAKELAASCPIALLATPPEPAVALAAGLRERGVRVIDLSNAHRATPGAVYGLTSLFAPQIAEASLVANPGCYATCIITAAAPLVRHGLVAGDLVVSAGSGVTGAGRTATEEMSLGEMYGEVRAYKVLRHQHVPEIERALGRVAPVQAPRVVFTPHLLPVARGIFATIHARLAKPWGVEDLIACYREDYADDPTTHVANTAEGVSLRRVVGTPSTLVGIAVDDRGYVCITAALDNLLKGAASQAVENLNLMIKQPRMLGLEHLARHA